MRDLPDLVEPLLQICREAGELICRHYQAPGSGDFEAKSDDSPLTRADIDSHALIQARLPALAPGVPVLSEESAAAHVAEHRHWRRFWMVDPLDGTKEFLARTGEFTINIALIEEHRPVLGVLYLPLERRGYAGIPGGGGYSYREGEGGWSRQPLATRPLREGAPLVVLASRRHGGERLRGCLDWLEGHWRSGVERHNSGSALKFCTLAEGGGDFYPRFSPCCEWDTAAGQAVLEAAGGALLGLDGQPLRYNMGDSLLSPQFYAIGDAGHPLWRELLRGGAA